MTLVHFLRITLEILQPERQPWNDVDRLLGSRVERFVEKPPTT